MKSKYIYLALVLFVFFVGFKLISKRIKRAPIGINEISATGTVILTFTPPTQEITPNTTFSVPIAITAGTTKVSAVEIEVIFDPAKLNLISVTQGTFLTNILSSPVITTGKVYFSYAVPPEMSGGKTGPGNLATLNFKALSTGQTNLVFGNNTLVAALGATSNVLKQASSIALTILSSSTPTPTPTPTITPSTIPSAIPSPLASATPSPTPTSNPADLVDTGDVTGDQVNLYDYNVFVINYDKTGTPGFIKSDITQNGIVDLYDYNMFVIEYSK